MDRNYYLGLRQEFQPKDIKTIFVLESPPASGKYFYDRKGKTSEPLFSAMMKDVLHNLRPSTKAQGLIRFQEAGYLLVDATYTPINNMTSKQRDEIIRRDYPDLVRDLDALSGKQSAKPKILLVKANVCRLLEARLLADKFNVVNAGTVVPFPGVGHQRKFAALLQKLL